MLRSGQLLFWPAIVAVALLSAPFVHAGWALADPPRRAASASGARTIDLDLKQADIANVLRLLADVGGVNLVLGEDVAGTITLRLRRVAWDDAFRIVLASKGLAMEREGNIIRVGREETFARERRTHLDARARCLATAPLRTRIMPVNYASAQALAAQIKATLTARGTVSVDQRTNTLIVRDVKCD